MKWILAQALLLMLLAGCAHSVKEAGLVTRESITNARAVEIALEAAMKRRWSEKMFTTTERTKDGWRVFVEEAAGRKRKGFVLVDGSGEVVEFRAVRE
jgi:hypothetical protein